MEISKYQKGKIYKIVDNTSDMIYIGSTIQSLSNRKAKHKNKYQTYLNGKCWKTTSFDIIANGNYDIILIENYPCNSKDELHARERYWIENTVCINKHLPSRTREEYRETHKEQKAITDKLYAEKNKEKIKEYKKKYYEENKVLKEKPEPVIKDPEIEKIKKAERFKKWLEIHREERKEYHKKCREAKNIKCNCEICGGKYILYNKKIHEKSLLHINALNK